ncbi:complex I NDUFA9 subunit family protein [Halovivax sp.]|uniref:complex I NDUFA9 subunit family protein n=1 Tax=Halovivax sp. TaxID=1935978 RepID=UPI0025C0631C|nr:complex I NDUFA9 subunit family protein [Halovivax sp.]
MDVLVAGGTGFIGSALCAELVDRGHEVAALAREPADAHLPARVDATAGDVTEPESLAEAVAGRDAIVNLVSPSPLFDLPDEAYESVHLGGTENLVRAAADADVDRFVQVSGLGVDPEAETAYLRAKGRAERVVRESSLGGVIVRPSIVFGEGSEFLWFVKLITTPYVTALPGGGRTRYQLIWVGDLAPMLADCVDQKERAGETYELGGPEELSLAQVTRQVYAAEGRSVRIVPVPMSISKAGMVLADPIPFVPFGADQGRALDLDNTVADNDVTAFGVTTDELTTLASYLQGSPERGEGREVRSDRTAGS